MNKLLKSSIISTRVLFIIFFSVVTVVVYFALSFVVGWELLTGVRGTDTLSYLSRLKFLANYFPHYPFWDPMQGAGLSPIYSYPVLTHTVVILVSRLGKINLIEALKLVSFSSVPLFSVGLFAYVWARFKKPIIAFIAGFLYILSPIAWIWLFEWGFYAESIAAIAFPFTILFFELFVKKAREGIQTFETRLYFVLTVILLAVSFLAHPSVLTAEVSFMVLYAFIVSFFQKEQKFSKSIRTVNYTVFLVLVSVALVAFWFVPFYEYTKAAQASAPGGGQIVNSGFYEVEIKLREVLNLKPLLNEATRRYAFRHVSFPLGISFLYLAGIVFLVLFRQRKAFAALAASFIMLLIATTTPFIIFLANVPIPFASNFASWRSFIYGARMFVPIGAALASYGLFRLLFSFLKPKQKLLLYSKQAVISLLALGFTVLVLLYFWNKPFNSFQFTVYGRGHETRDIRDIWKVRRDDPCDFDAFPEQAKNPQCLNNTFRRYVNVQEFRFRCSDLRNLVTEGQSLPELCLEKETIEEKDVYEFLETCRTNANHLYSQTICKAKVEPFIAQVTNKNMWLEKLKGFSQSEEIGGILKATLDQIPEDNFVRYDSSPNAVIYAQLGPYIKDTTPQLNTYFSPSSLINKLWGYYISNFYADDPVFSDPAALLELANWFGVKYIISGAQDDKEKFEAAGFIKNPGYEVYEYQNAEPIVALSTKPSVLVINRADVRTYDLVFQRAPFGLIPYEKAFIVKGKENIDDYSLEELKKFDTLFLQGYKYRNRKIAWKLLEQYVTGGGSLFIESGWQFTSADWDAGETAEFFPTTSLSWTNFGKTSDYQLHEGVVDIKEIELAGFEPLIWNDQPWGVSSGDTLRSWAKPILTVKGHPMVAGGQYGEGKVIWSGMNLLGHTGEYSGNHPENIFTSRLVAWLLERDSSRDYVFRKDFTGERPHPDRVEFVINTSINEPSSFYFKESYYPRWKAKLVMKESTKDLKIYSAGPGFMFMQLPQVSPGDKLELTVVKSWSDYAASGLSLLVGIGLIMYLIKIPLFRKIKLPFNIRFSNKLSGLTSREEEDY